MPGFYQMCVQRQSCRKFDPDRRPEKETLLACVEAARLAPSACNSQPWRFTVVNDPEMSPKAAKCAQSAGSNKFTNDCPAFIVIWETAAVLAPRVSAALGPQYFAQIDIGIVAAHICYAAQEQGLSTCILGWIDEVRLIETLGSANGRPRLMIAVGYPKGDVLRDKARKPLGEIMDYIG